MALPAIHRLKHRQDFSAVYQSGLRRTAPHLTLRALRCSESGSSIDAIAPQSPMPTRIGISISQKVSKRAVVRNRIKRQIRAALWQLLPDISPGWQIVINVRPGAIPCDYQQFLQELKQILIAAEVIHGH